MYQESAAVLIIATFVATIARISFLFKQCLFEEGWFRPLIAGVGLTAALIFPVLVALIAEIGPNVHGTTAALMLALLLNPLAGLWLLGVATVRRVKGQPALPEQLD